MVAAAGDDGTVVGCADPDVMPQQTWFERSADGLTATIGCVNADVKWTVRCVDNAWLGYHANCTLGQSVSSLPSQTLLNINNATIQQVQLPLTHCGRLLTM